jgi:hypothetical protein
MHVAKGATGASDAAPIQRAVATETAFELLIISGCWNMRINA